MTFNIKNIQNGHSTIFGIPNILNESRDILILINQNSDTEWASSDEEKEQKLEPKRKRERKRKKKTRKITINLYHKFKLKKSLQEKDYYCNETIDF